MNREEILLKEYEVCQSHNNSIGSQVWLSTSIFMSVNVGLLGWVAYAITTGRLPFRENSAWLVLALGLGIIFMFVFWMRWLNRMQFLTSVNYERMRQIENELGMWKNLLVHGLGLKYSDAKTAGNWEQLSDEHKSTINELSKLYPSYSGWKYWTSGFPKYAPPRGFEGSRGIAKTVMTLWVGFIIMAFVFSKLC